MPFVALKMLENVSAQSTLSSHHERCEESCCYPIECLAAKQEQSGSRGIVVGCWRLVGTGCDDDGCARLFARATICTAHGLMVISSTLHNQKICHSLRHRIEVKTSNP